MDIKNAEIYLRNSEIEKHKKIKTTQSEYFDGIRSIPINQIEVEQNRYAMACQGCGIAIFCFI